MAARIDGSVPVHVADCHARGLFCPRPGLPGVESCLETNLLNVSLNIPPEVRENIVQRLAVCGAKAETGPPMPERSRATWHRWNSRSASFGENKWLRPQAAP